VYNGTNWVCTFQNLNDPTPNITALFTAGGGNEERGRDIAVDIDGNVFITGSFQGTANFGTISKSVVGSSDIFIAKYSKVGILQWVQTVGGTGNDYGGAIAIGVDGNVIITGGFSGTADFGGVSKSSTGDTDIFVAKYTNSGTLQWV
jgi:hypothetical protein